MSSLLSRGMTVAFDRAKNWRIFHHTLSVLLLIFPLCLSKYFTLGFGLFLLFTIRAVQFYSNLSNKKWISRGRSWHQKNLYADGLGENPPTSTVSEIHRYSCKAERKEESDYFASAESKGPSRLIENVAESAYYTAANAEFWRNALLIPNVFFSSSLIYFLANGFGELNQQESLKILLAVAAFLMFGDLASRTLELTKLEKSCTELYAEGLRILEKTSELSEIEAKEFTFKYAQALSGTGPIPTFIHNWTNEKNGRSWKASLENLKSKKRCSSKN